jgi:hypothetical protein
MRAIDASGPISPLRSLQSLKNELQLNAYLYTLLQILSVSVFETTEISCALQPGPSLPEMLLGGNQLNLFDFYLDITGAHQRLHLTLFP